MIGVLIVNHGRFQKADLSRSTGSHHERIPTKFERRKQNLSKPEHVQSNVFLKGGPRAVGTRLTSQMNDYVRNH